MKLSDLQVGTFIMHEDALDCCIEIMHLYDTAPTDPPRFKGRWWNLGYTGTPWLVQSPTRMYNMQIGPKEAHQWLKLNYDDLETPRLHEGPPRRAIVEDESD